MKQKKLDNLFKQAYVIAENSPDLQTQVGSLLVRKSDGAIISSGYNGFIRGAADKYIPNTRPEKHKYILHSEKNLIYHCARNGISMRDCFVVVTLSPCVECMKALFQSGVDTIYFETKYYDFSNQLNRLDFKINLTKIGRYYKIKLEVQKYENNYVNYITNAIRSVLSISNKKASRTIRKCVKKIRGCKKKD